MYCNFGHSLQSHFLSTKRNVAWYSLYLFDPVYVCTFKTKKVHLGSAYVCPFWSNKILITMIKVGEYTYLKYRKVYIYIYWSKLMLSAHFGRY